MNGPCRHYGGTKLGTGGLARAYGGAARECLQLAEKEVYKCLTAVQMKVTDCSSCLRQKGMFAGACHAFKPCFMWM